MVAFAIGVLACVISAISALNSLCKVGKLAKDGRVCIRTNIDKALRSVGIDCIDGKRDGYCFV